MGVVYRAHDEQLDRDVAIKFLPPRTLSDESARRRFRKEALALAKLNHPNIGGIYEFGSQDGCDFLVMELISGLRLDTKLAAGPLTEDEILRLGIQLADGLQEAHRQGIVHRDLKPGNLRLTSDGRLKILDFGLADWTQTAEETAATITLTRTDYASGTVPYMSPEQLRGRQPDARSDIYSAGVVLYEMATGKRPYSATGGPQLISAILESPPPPPSSHNRRLSHSVELILLKALDKNPERRYQSAKELRIDLERVSSGAAPQRGRHYRGLTSVVAAMAVLAVVFGFNVGRLRERVFPSRPVVPVAATPSRRSLAVLGFKNLSGRPDSTWISTALSEMLTTELAAGEKLRIVPGENVARMKLNLAPNDTDSYGPDTLAKIRNLLGSDLVVSGSYLDLGKESGGKIRLDFRLQDAISGETIASVSEAGTEDELLDLVSRSGEELRQKLGMGGLSDADSSIVRASVPANTEAARLYSQGLAKLRIFEATAARDLLQQAVLKDSQHAPTHAALAEAWSLMGYDVKAQAEAKMGLELSTGVSREERLLVEGRYRELMSDWPKAIEVYRSLWEFFPDNLEYALRLASAQTAAGNGKDALQTIEAARHLPPPEGADARIDLAEARAAESLGDFKQEGTAAERAIQKARALGNRLVLAQALVNQGWALLRTGDPQKANISFVEAGDLYSAAGDQRGTGSALIYQGEVLYDNGDFNGARQAYQDALTIFGHIGARLSMARALNNIGNVLYEQGKLAEAKGYYEQTLALDRELAARGAIAGSLGNIANVLDAMGDLAGARKMQEQSLSAFREVGDQRGTASTLDNLGNVLMELGDLTGASNCYEEALAILEKIGYKRGRSFALAELGAVRAEQGDLEGARQRMEESLAIREELRELDMAAQSRTQLSTLALEQGRYADGVALARQAAQQFQQDKSSENEAWAQSVLARNLLCAGNLSDAKQAADRAVSLASQSTNRYSRFEATLASARVLAATGKTAHALAQLDLVLNEATKYGYLSYQYEARLAMAEVELQAGKAASARALLSSLEKDAQSSGFARIANRSKSARS
jgi:serine/threonine protein kinase/tetratricopeptide (TPR) repeat protein